MLRDLPERTLAPPDGRMNGFVASPIGKQITSLALNRCGRGSTRTRQKKTELAEIVFPIVDGRLKNSFARERMVSTCAQSVTFDGCVPTTSEKD